MNQFDIIMLAQEDEGIHLARDLNKCWAAVNTVMAFRVPQNAGISRLFVELLTEDSGTRGRLLICHQVRPFFYHFPRARQFYRIEGLHLPGRLWCSG